MGRIKELFLKLTEYTIPHGYEDKLAPILKEFNLSKDSIGNYYKVIGKSETLFTTHLDTYSKKYEKVKHVIEGNIIKTDGSTILGGDNKLGCSILLYMIENNIPGNYYFFLGEEPIISGGLYGSKNALSKNRELFSKFKRAIAFDRKQTGSIVTRQMARRCCSDVFGNALIEQFEKQGMSYNLDSKAYYTDTATFMDTIPECTNISAGGWNEHYTTEYVDISYTEKLGESALKIDWENLPVSREIKKFDIKVKKFSNKISKKTLENILSLLDKYDHLNTNLPEFSSGSTNVLEFNTWFEDTDVKVKFENNSMYVSFGNKEFLEVKSIKDLDLKLSDQFGVQFDMDSNYIDFDQEGNIIIIDEDDKEIKYNLSDYIKLFNSINSEKTSYKLEKGGEQFLDVSNEPLYKNQFFNWLNSIFN